MVRIPSLSRRTEPAHDDTTVQDTDADRTVDTDRDGAADPDGAADRDATTRDGAAGRSGRPVVTDRTDERTTYRSAAADTRDGAATDDRTTTDTRHGTATASRDGAATDGRDGDAARRAADRAAVARAATRSDEETRRTSAVPIDPTLERPVDGRPTDRDGAVAGADRTRDTAVDRDGDGVPDRAERPVVAGPKPRASLLATLGLVTAVAGVLFVLTGTLAGYGIGLGAAGAVLAVLGLMATRRRHVAGTTDALLGIVAGVGAVVLGILAMTGQFDWPTTDGDWVARFREWLDSQFVDRF